MSDLERSALPYQKPKKYTRSVSKNKVRVCYHLCIRHILGIIFGLHQCSENLHCYFYIIEEQDEPQHEKTNNVDSDQVLHKPGCAVTGDG